MCIECGCGELRSRLESDDNCTVTAQSFKSHLTCLLTYLLTDLLTYLLTHSLHTSEKLTGLQLVKKFPSFYETRKFIPALTSARLNPDPTSHFLNIHLNITLPSTPGSPQWSLSYRFPHQNPVHASLLPSELHALPTSLSSIIFNFHSWALKMWLMGCPESR
jgi:hypothetical protein